MRVQRSDFLLNFKIRDLTEENSNLKFNAFGSKFQPLELSCVQHGQMHSLEVVTHLPNDVFLVFSGLGDRGIELVDLSLVGISIDKSILNKKVEYKQTTSLNNVMTVASECTLCWPNNGCAIFKFFHPDPFAYHLFIGNKIIML